MKSDGADYIAQAKILHRGEHGFEELVEVTTPVDAHDHASAYRIAAWELTKLIQQAQQRMLARDRAEAENQRRSQAMVDGLLGAGGGMAESPPPMAEQLRELIGLLRDVADSGVEFEVVGVRYVTVQIDRETWDQLKAYRSPGG